MTDVFSTSRSVLEALAHLYREFLGTPTAADGAKCVARRRSPWDSSSGYPLLVAAAEGLFLRARNPRCQAFVTPGMPPGLRCIGAMKARAGAVIIERLRVRSTL